MENDQAFSSASLVNAGVVSFAVETGVFVVSWARALSPAKATANAIRARNGICFILPTPWSGPREPTQEQPSKYPPATGDARSCARRHNPTKTTSRWRWHWNLEGPVQRRA